MHWSVLKHNEWKGIVLKLFMTNIKHRWFHWPPCRWHTSPSWVILIFAINSCHNINSDIYSFTIYYWSVGWLVVLRINVDLAIFQPYLDLEAGDNQSLKIQVRRAGIEPGPLAPKAKSLTIRPPLLLIYYSIDIKFRIICDLFILKHHCSKEYTYYCYKFWCKSYKSLLSGYTWIYTTNMRGFF